MLEIIFLFLLGLAWVLAATIQDIRTTEIANWLNFSLAIFAIAFRFFYSLFSNDFNFLYQGLIGLAIFFILGNLLYKARMFAGGDAKLFISLGAILPVYSSFYDNLNSFLFFLVIFLIVGALYSIASSVVLCVGRWRDFRKEFRRQFNFKKRFFILMTTGAVALALLGLIIEPTLAYLGILALVIPYLYLYAKSVDEAAMVQQVLPAKLMEGDWLYKDVKIGKTVLRANWDGLTKNQIALLKRHKKKVWIRRGVPFAGVFIISIFFYFYFYFIDLRYTPW